jgi:uncharacterized protein YjbI with pentapeptide repeats
MTILLVSASLSCAPNCRYQDVNSRQAAALDLSGMELEDAELDGTELEDAELDETELEDAELDGTELEDDPWAGGAFPELPLHAAIVSAAMAVRMAPILARMNVPSLLIA